VCRWTNDWNKGYYQLLNYWYHQGLIQADTLALTHEEYLANIATGIVLGMSDQHWNFNDGQNPLRAEGRYERTFVSLDFANPGAELNWIGAPAFSGSNGINITTSNPDPVRFIQFMDWIIQEEVQRFLSWGIEGEHWYFDENGVITRFPEQRVLQADPVWGEDNLGTVLRNRLPKMSGTFSDGNATEVGQSLVETLAQQTEWEKGFFERYGIHHRNGFMRSVPYNPPVFYPFWGMPAPPDGSEAQFALTRVNETNVVWLARLVIAPEDQFDTLWEEYQTALKEINQQPVFDFLTEEAYRMIAAVGG
jgi:putative aldouronate transport system substrate-binding protein